MIRKLVTSTRMASTLTQLSIGLTGPHCVHCRRFNRFGAAQPEVDRADIRMKHRRHKPMRPKRLVDRCESMPSERLRSALNPRCPVLRL